MRTNSRCGEDVTSSGDGRSSVAREPPTWWTSNATAPLRFSNMITSPIGASLRRHRRLAVGLNGGADRRRELADAAVEEELLGLRSRLEWSRVGVARLVVVARAALGRKRRNQLRRHRDVTPGDRPSSVRALLARSSRPARADTTR